MSRRLREAQVPFWNVEYSIAEILIPREEAHLRFAIAIAMWRKYLIPRVKILIPAFPRISEYLTRRQGLANKIPIKEVVYPKRLTPACKVTNK